MKRKSILDDELEQGGKEFTYLLKVIDYDTKTTMYYDVKLNRVEIEKEIENNSLSEHLEVIEEYDEDEDNPFSTEFDLPDDYKKKEE